VPQKTPGFFWQVSWSNKFFELKRCVCVCVRSRTDKPCDFLDTSIDILRTLPSSELGQECSCLSSWAGCCSYWLTLGSWPEPWTMDMKMVVLSCLPILWQVRAIDYRREDGRFPVSMSFVTISNPDSLSSSETGVNPSIRSWKKHLSEWARCQKAICSIYFTKKWRADTLPPGLEFDSFKPWLKSGIFKCISWLNG
jgi:hypothetical protein